MINRNLTRAVITGPTGVIGSALCQELVKNGTEVYAVCRPGSKRMSVLPRHEKLKIVECALEALSNLPGLIPGGADAFYHFGWSHTAGTGRNDMRAQIQNIQYTLDAVAAAYALGCRVFLGAGSQAEYGRFEGLLKAETPCFPENGYGMAKLCAGQMSRAECQKLGMEHVWVRILSIYGPGDGVGTMISSVIGKLLVGEKPALTAGEQQWDYLFSEDAALAFRLLAEHGVDGKTYVLGNGTAQPLRKYVEILRDAIDPALPLGFGEVPYGSKQVMYLQADISELTRDTGFAPRISFAEGIEKTINQFKEG